MDKYLDTSNALIYNFKGIIISRLKVLRIYSMLLKNGIEDSIDAFLYSITYNTLISKEKYEQLFDYVKNEVEVG